ncbi:threonylcarbamoyl-AMP synthase [Candidatus Falkowbacteria bacterium CG10_big_fil_rev_8_21_14_0_10_43_10]|uniref:L-threonylcarbamoyladenylate synthase n=1 Tax=Candidatus Falkowbacteria bacterium CG10_big_fil_rev_8_21_14_0_10_43_10 TaxID=1974567 RepID=A0A2H0V540_9BACT|nr:MAG: threonylcarbamoyl-AMP synthase [Candidatus Falkowbacteria bacterium CG10_big_fil_rev_8_21_14_0_10_43_10]
MNQLNYFSKDGIVKIAGNLKRRKVGVFPADTVYGLGGRADKSSVIKKVYRLKKRDKKKPFLILVSSMSMAKKYVEINEKQEKFLRSKWPGKLTAVLESKGILPKELSGTGKIGVRFPNNKWLRKIIRRLGAPLIATSANLSGQPSVIDSKDIKIRPDFIVDSGKLPKSRESTIVDLTGDKIMVLRQGDLKIK